jgi:hypothetical protein
MNSEFTVFNACMLPFLVRFQYVITFLRRRTLNRKSSRN